MKTNNSINEKLNKMNNDFLKFFGDEMDYTRLMELQSSALVEMLQYQDLNMMAANDNELSLHTVSGSNMSEFLFIVNSILQRLRPVGEAAKELIPDE